MGHEREASDSISERKRLLRLQLLQSRRAQDAGSRAERSQAIVDRLLGWEALRGAATVGSYAATEDEPSLDDLHDALVHRGQSVAYPRLQAGRRMTFRRVTDLAGLLPARLGLRQPDPDAAPVAPAELDAVLVPGVAFDASGHRLGRGAGYYDRFLAALRPDATMVGISFAFQVVASVPVDSHDRPVDFIVTDDALIACTAQREESP
jgi:5-formyltetrahydrofolate cyclo-ligase